jgi:hypothetical protein
VEDIQTRVSPPIPSELRAELRPYPGHRLPFPRLPLHESLRRHPRRRHGPRQNPANPRVARLAPHPARHRAKSPASSSARKASCSIGTAKRTAFSPTSASPR